MVNTLNKFNIMCLTISKNDGKWEYWENLLESHESDNDYVLLKSKLDNFISLLNEFFKFLVKKKI
jgi:hypothetical protein